MESLTNFEDRLNNFWVIKYKTRKQRSLLMVLVAV